MITDPQPMACKPERLLQDRNRDLLKLALNRKGQTTSPELFALALLSSEVEKPNVIVETGTLYGRTTLALLAGSKTYVYSIDINQQISLHLPIDLITYNKFELIKGDVIEVAKTFTKPVGLLFIDDNHMETARTIKAWLPHLGEKAIVAMHDFNLPKVQEGGRELLQHGFSFDCWSGLIGIFRRKKPMDRYAPNAWIQTPYEGAIAVWK